MKCPLCGEGTIKNREGTQVYCSGYKAQQDGKMWFNAGTCEFHIAYNQKPFGKKLTKQEMTKLLNGEPLRNSKGDMLTLDLANTDFFTKCEFAARPEDEDF